MIPKPQGFDEAKTLIENMYEDKFRETLTKLKLMDNYERAVTTTSNCVYCGKENADFSIDGKAFHIECIPPKQ